MWPHAQAAERSVVYCSLSTGIISELFSHFLKWPERLGVQQTQKVLMAETWSFSGGCLIISQLSSNCSNPIKHMPLQQIKSYEDSTSIIDLPLSLPLSAAVSFCPALPSSHSRFRLAFSICVFLLLKLYFSFFLPSSFLSFSFILAFPPILFSYFSFLLFFFLSFFETWTASFIKSPELWQSNKMYLWVVLCIQFFLEIKLMSWLDRNLLSINESAVAAEWGFVARWTLSDHLWAL